MNISSFKHLSDLFQTIGSVPRLQVLLAIGDAEPCVCHLEATLGHRQAYLSQHLMALRKAGIVTSSRDGRNIHYRLTNPEFLELIRRAALLMGQDLPDSSPFPNCDCPDCSRRLEANSPAPLYKECLQGIPVSISEKALWRTEEDDKQISKDEHWANVDENNRLIFPREVREHYGIHSGTQVLLKEGPKSLRMQRPVTQLTKVYVEPTSRCNLNCRTCLRNAWEEPQGDMSPETWQRVLASLKALPYRPEIFFGGFGEPLTHPAILTMVEQAKPLARSIELITNGMLLTEQVARRLIQLDLDVLWISVDGANAENMADVRIGATLQQIFDNIGLVNLLRHEIARKPEIGISFVAMRRNIADLPALLRMGPKLGVSRFMVTNVLPYTEEMCKEMLYTRVVDGVDSTPSPFTPRIDLPRIDLDDTSKEAIIQAMRYRHNVTLNGVSIGQDHGRCPFIERGSVAICWDGSVSPCLALMHRYNTFLHNRPRSVERHTVGNINEQDLGIIWDQKEYVNFRKRVAAFDFSPCTWCGGCSWSEANQEDCFANTFPTCGGCLWAQGVIQCP